MLNPFIGVFGVIAASGLFVAIAEDVATGDALTRVNLAVVQWFHSRTYPAMTSWMRGISDLHSVMAISIYVTLLVLYMSWKRDWVWLVFLVAVVPGGMLLNETMKHLFQRARPILDHAIDPAQLQFSERPRCRGNFVLWCAGGFH